MNRTMVHSLNPTNVDDEHDVYEQIKSIHKNIHSHDISTMNTNNHK